MTNVAPILTAGWLLAESLMVDTCTIARRTTVTDENTGVQTPTDTELYDGRCRAQQGVADGQRADAGEVSVILLRVELQLPVAGTEGIAEGDIVTITAATFDDDLVGKVFRVRDVQRKTHPVMRRLRVEEVTS